MKFRHACAFVVAAAAVTGSVSAGDSNTPAYDLLIRNGTIYDGSGGKPYTGEIAIKGDRIVYVGPRAPGRPTKVVNAGGKAVTPGFVNMLSHSQEAFFVDSRVVSDINQGVTLNVMGEGWSMGPLTPKLREAALKDQGDIQYLIEWTTLDEFLRTVEKRGVATNVASFIGATTVRLAVLGEGDVDPSPAQLEEMRGLVAQAMRDGAMGVGSSLIYPPAGYAETPELIALTTEAGRCGGMYISHMRSEGDRIEQAVDELIEIARKSGAGAEIYHLKFAGKDNWGKFASVIAKIEAARAEGLRITTDMYTYDAGATGLTATLPLWVQADGAEAMAKRLRDPATRARVIADMRAKDAGYENLLRLTGGTGDNILLIGFKSEALRPLIGKTLAEAARARGVSVEEAAMDLIVEDGSRVDAAFRIMSEDNIRKAVQLPYMSFGSDAPGQAAEGVFLKSSTHPRTYGNVARLLGRYVRDEKLIPLEEAVRRLTSLPAANLRLRDRGLLKAGYFADVVLFDPTTIQDHATYERPHQYSTGVDSVWVNGVAVLKDGKPTGAAAGRVVRGPGWTGWPDGGACPK
ncbi:N-acyl-D-amino-acid deacylase family protein [Sphingobium algorifonticola]|uniref:N-acyl-D-amino-acid deacylase family protein n=1 Tax=Sphingobium algorifonticola TaxID=2008318 RepID=UPI001F49C98F|nr:D-aminoacylase [Sphingobium algorifonticola]